MTRPLPPSATRAASALTAYANAVGCPLGGPGLKPADLTVPPHRRGGHHDRRMVQAPIAWGGIDPCPQHGPPKKGEPELFVGETPASTQSGRV